MTVLSASFASTASYVATASFANNSLSSSYAVTASYALNAGGAASFPYTGSAQITGSFGVTGSATIQSGSFSGSFVTNLGDTFTNVPAATKIVTLDSSSYGTLLTNGTADPNTLYFVSGGAQTVASASYAVSASNAATASYFSGSVASASFATSASIAATASYYSGSVTSASFASTSSFALTASFATSASIAATASYYSGSVVSASYSVTSSFSNFASTASLAQTASFAASASIAATASYYSGSVVSASYAVTASYALNAGGAASFPYTGSAQITGSLGVTGSANIQSGSFSGSFVSTLGDTYTDVPAATKIVTLTSASYASLTPKDANTLYIISGSNMSASYALQALSSSFAFTASYALNAGGAASFPYTGSAQITGSLGVTGSINIQSGSQSGSVVSNVGDIYTDVPFVKQIVTLTSASYAALSPKDPNTLYVISGSFVTGSGGGGGAAFPYTGAAVITGSLTVTGSYAGNVISASISSNTASINLSAAQYYTCLVSASTTFFNVTGVQPGETATLVLTTVGNATASFSSNVKQPSGSLYRPTQGTGNIDVLSLVAVDSTNVYLVAAKKFV